MATHETLVAQAVAETTQWQMPEYPQTPGVTGGAYGQNIDWRGVGGGGMGGTTEQYNPTPTLAQDYPGYPLTAVYRCSRPNSHVWSCKHETKCECGQVERILVPDGM